MIAVPDMRAVSTVTLMRIVPRVRIVHASRLVICVAGHAAPLVATLSLGSEGMTVVKRLLIAVLTIAILGALAEFGLRAFMPSVIEGGVRIPLRVAQTSAVDVTMEGSAALNALRGRIADVSVTAENVPLDEEVSARADMSVGSVPLLPLVGRLRDGTASFTIPADQLSRAMGMMTAGAVHDAEMREGALFAEGAFVVEGFELPFSGAFEFAADSGDIVVTPGELSVPEAVQLPEAVRGQLSAPRTVCIADRLPKGVTVTGIDVAPSGEITLEAKLSEGLLSNPEDRFRGTCEG